MFLCKASIHNSGDMPSAKASATCLMLARQEGFNFFLALLASEFLAKRSF
jgi:hypothetical protein